MSDHDLDSLRDSTDRGDRLQEDGGDDGEDEGERAYASITDVVLREAAGDDVAELRKQTERDRRVDVTETEEVELVPHETLELPDGTLDVVDDPYCGNCSAVAFKKRDGEPTPVCETHDCPTRLESGMVCGEYDPQGL
jgi:hypothetical protein